MYLGIDLGTSGLRALLTDAAGTPVHSVQSDYDTDMPRKGWSEQDPDLWIRAMDQVMPDLPDRDRIAGIAVAGHMHGAVLLDGDDRVLRPCILWNDTRAHAEADALDAADGVRADSGNIVFPGFTAPKLMWVADNEPQIFAKLAKVLLPASYMTFHLTGEHVIDMSDASGTAWLDVGGRSWSGACLDASGMVADQMPRLVEGCAPAGSLRDDLAERWGLTPGIPVAGGAGDNAAAAIGTGITGDGKGFVSLGTSGVVLAGRDGFDPDPGSAVHTFCHALPDTWYQMGVMLSATGGLNWFSAITGMAPADLVAELDETPQGPGDVVFLPYLSGERTPHNDPNVRGSFHGLSGATTRAQMTQAVLEGVAFGLRDCADALRRAGARLDDMLLIGGGSRSAYWGGLLATVLDVELTLPEGGEFGGALGAARLARLAATGEDPADVVTSPARGRTFSPNQDLKPAYEAAHDRFRSLYRP